jgi:hypothetical protein
MSFEILLSLNTSRSTVIETEAVCSNTVMLETAMGNFALTYMFNEEVKNHFITTFQGDSVTEEYGAYYPIL